MDDKEKIEFISNYCLSSHSVLLGKRKGIKEGFIKYLSIFGTNYNRITNDNNDAMHCPMTGDIVFWENNVAICSDAIPGETYITCKTINGEEDISYDSILGRLQH